MGFLKFFPEVFPINVKCALFGIILISQKFVLRLFKSNRVLQSRTEAGQQIFTDRQVETH